LAIALRTNTELRYGIESHSVTAIVLNAAPQPLREWPLDKYDVYLKLLSEQPNNRFKIVCIPA
jgi:hypothetical protein